MVGRVLEPPRTTTTGGAQGLADGAGRAGGWICGLVRGIREVLIRRLALRYSLGPRAFVGWAQRVWRGQVSGASQVVCRVWQLGLG